MFNPANRQIALILSTSAKSQAKLLFNYDLSTAYRDGENVEDPLVISEIRNA